MKITYRLARAEDVPTITALVSRSIRALHSESYDDDLIEEAIRHAYGADWQLVRDRSYFVAEIEDRVVGAGGWSYRQTLAGAHGPDATPAPALDPQIDAARIRAFYVDPALARVGIGRALLQKSEAAAAQAGFRWRNSRPHSRPYLSTPPRGTARSGPTTCPFQAEQFSD